MLHYIAMLLLQCPLALGLVRIGLPACLELVSPLLVHNRLEVIVGCLQSLLGEDVLLGKELAAVLFT
eukprot:14886732-Heterocapsa_arctica.AAC.1